MDGLRIEILRKRIERIRDKNNVIMDMFNEGFYSPSERKEFITHNARKIEQL